MENQSQRNIKIDKKKLKKSLLGNALEKYATKKDLTRKFISFSDEIFSYKTLERIGGCGNLISHLTNEEMNVKKVHKAELCGNRFCPLCTWNKSKKDALMISVMMEAVRELEKQEYIMLTLTSPNVKGEDLHAEIDKFNKAFHKLFKRRNVNKINNGYIRKLEVTTDQEKYITSDLYKRKQDYFEKRNLKIGDANPQFDTYNPHFHIIISVNKSYFKSRDYIKQKAWIEMWQDCMDDMRITQVDVRKVRSSEKSEMGAILEVAKYSAKSSDLYHSKSVFQTFYFALKGRQLLTFNGFFKEYKKKYSIGELDRFKNTDENYYTHMLDSVWRTSRYESTIRKLTENELNEFNNVAKKIEDNDLIE